MEYQWRCSESNEDGELRHGGREKVNEMSRMSRVEGCLAAAPIGCRGHLALPAGSAAPLPDVACLHRCRTHVPSRRAYKEQQEGTRARRMQLSH